MNHNADKTRLLHLLLRLPLGSAAAWAISAAGLTLATGLRMAFNTITPGYAPFIFFFPVVLLAALAGGFRVGATTTVMAALVSWFFLIPPRETWADAIPQGISLAGFVLVALLLAWVAARLRLYDAQLRGLNAELEARVEDRTRSLVEEAQRREAAEERARQSQRLEAVGQLTGGVAHDFNNLLTVVIGSLAAVQRALESETPATPDELKRLRRLTEAALDASRRGAALNRRLLAFARKQTLQPVVLDANALVAGMSDVLRRTLGERVDVETVLAGGLWRTKADPTELEAALLNLAVNARDAMPEGGKLTIETTNAWLDGAYAAQHSEVEPGQYVMLAVSDTGTGMPPEVVARAFEPFFTTKPVGVGTGLGVSQVFGFAKQSGGHLKIYSEPGHGTTVKLYLPRALDSAAASAMPDAPLRRSSVLPVAQPGETVLLVEDDSAVRTLAADTLRDLGYRVLEAPDAAGALAALSDDAGICLLVTDVGLPNGMNGRELAQVARSRRPALPVLFTTACHRPWWHPRSRRAPRAEALHGRGSGSRGASDDRWTGESLVCAAGPLHVTLAGGTCGAPCGGGRAYQGT